MVTALSAVALDALGVGGAADLGHRPTVTNAVRYLADRQSTAGCWRYSARETAASAWALRLLDPTSADAVSGALAYLARTQQTSGLWDGSPSRTAWVLLAISLRSQPKPAYPPALIPAITDGLPDGPPSLAQPTRGVQVRLVAAPSDPELPLTLVFEPETDLLRVGVRSGTTPDWAPLLATIDAIEAAAAPGSSAPMQLDRISRVRAQLASAGDLLAETLDEQTRSFIAQLQDGTLLLIESDQAGATPAFDLLTAGDGATLASRLAIGLKGRTGASTNFPPRPRRREPAVLLLSTGATSRSDTEVQALERFFGRRGVAASCGPRRVPRLRTWMRSDRCCRRTIGTWCTSAVTLTPMARCRHSSSDRRAGCLRS